MPAGYSNKKQYKEKARALLEPIVSTLSSLGVSPFLITLFGLVFSLYAAVVIARGSIRAGGVWLVLAGICDVLDGSLARRTGSVTKFGAFIDSTLDRISELAVFSGLIIHYMTDPEGYNVTLIVVVCVALSASMLISYARARLEGLGYTCTVGLMERTERMVLLIVGLLLGGRLLVAVLVLLAFASVLTVLQRIWHGYRVTRGET